LTAHDVRQALAALAEDRSSATVAIAHNALTRMIRHAEGRDLVRRNVAAPKVAKGLAGARLIRFVHGLAAYVVAGALAFLRCTSRKGSSIYDHGHSGKEQRHTER
jgi:hypothetical protein